MARRGRRTPSEGERRRWPPPPVTSRALVQLRTLSGVKLTIYLSMHFLSMLLYKIFLNTFDPVSQIRRGIPWRR